jgi:hypothetical protein
MLLALLGDLRFQFGEFIQEPGLLLLVVSLECRQFDTGRDDLVVGVHAGALLLLVTVFFADKFFDLALESSPPPSGSGLGRSHFALYKALSLFDL